VFLSDDDKEQNYKKRVNNASPFKEKRIYFDQITVLCIMVFQRYPNIHYNPIKKGGTMSAPSQVVRRGPYPELTLPGLLIGYVLGIVIALSIGYAALILGFSIEGSELAAILGFGILRGLMGRSSIVENNINQTVASAVNGASSGMMFSVPALFILGQTDFSAVVMIFATIAGGILGVGFIIPLRKQMIDFERLTYPGGVAVAAILKSPGAGIKKTYYLLGGALISAIVHFISQYTHFENWNLGAQIGMPDYMNGVWYISLLTLGAAYIAGKGGVYFIVGGFVSYWVLAPLMDALGWLPSMDMLQSAATDMPNYLRLHMFRPVGIGMLIGGALTGIVLALPLIVSAIKSMQSAGKVKSAVSQDEMPIKILYIAVGLAALLLFVIAIYSTHEMGFIRGASMALLGVLWIWVAGVILSESIGRTNWSPLSGMTLIAVTILIIISSGLSNNAAIISSLLVGAAACVAMSQATDMMMDLKTGYLVGATPRMQQMAQFMGVWIGPIIVMGLIFVLHQAYGMGSERLPAPQGQALASMITGILGGDVPVDKYIAGAGIGAMLSATGIGGLGVLVGLGFYLPFNIVLTYSLGTLLRLLTDWKLGKQWSEEFGIPAAAGLIVGEALVGVGFAIYFILQGMGG